MLLVIAVLLAASGGEAAQAVQAEPSSGRSFTAVRVVPVGADDAEGGRSGVIADRAPILAAEQAPAAGWYSLYGGNHFGLLVDGVCCGIPYGTNVRMRIQENHDLNDDNASSFLFNLFFI